MYSLNYKDMTRVKSIKPMKVNTNVHANNKENYDDATKKNEAIYRGMQKSKSSGSLKKSKNEKSKNVKSKSEKTMS